MSSKNVCSVISHTHWDREWYLGFETFRLRLVDLIDGVLELLEAQPGYVYHLDAQTIVLDDYLEIRPHARGRLEAQIAAGRLLVGPWYVQNDFFLTSGEATFRNLKEGMARANAFGACMKVGYMPDQFGLAGQLPQILRAFGIDTAVFGRGYTFWEKTPEGRVHRRQPTELWWDSPDGSRVLGVHLCNWYNNAQRFSADVDKSTRYARKIIADFGDRPQTSQLLLMNGVDHLEAQPDLLGILAAVQQRLPDVEIRQSSLPTYLAATRKELAGLANVPVWKGELRQGADYDMLVGTLSSRVYLKAQNVRAQNRLEKVVEPLFALAKLAGFAGLAPHDELAYAWRLLMQNHPHDSICGCSVDAVHDRMEDRTARLMELTAALTDRGLRALQGHVTADPGNGTVTTPGAFTVLVVNTLGWARSPVVRAELFFPEDLGDVVDFSLTGPDGKPVAYSVLDTNHRSWASLSPVNLPGTLLGKRFMVEFLPGEVPAWGWKLFTVRPGQPGKKLSLAAAPATTTEATILDNGLVRVTVHTDGQVDLAACDGSWSRTDVLGWLDESDAGDSYVHHSGHGVGDVKGFSGPVTVARHGSTALRPSCQIAGEMRVPEGWNFATKRRSGKKTKVGITLELSLDAGSTRVGFHVTVHNTAREHRLRAILRFGAPMPLAVTSAPFELVERPYIDPAAALRVRDEPTSGLVHLGDWALLTEGLHEYELLDAHGTVALTLLRATGRIGADVGTPETAPEVWLCPGGQVRRAVDLRFALETPARKDRSPAAGLRALDEAFVDVLVRYDAADALRLAGGRPAVQESDLREVFTKPDPWKHLALAARGTTLSHSLGPVQISALYPAQGGVVLRLYNPTAVPQNCRLPKTPAWSKATQVDGADNPFSELTAGPQGLSFTVAPAQILSLLLHDAAFQGDSL